MKNTLSQQLKHELEQRIKQLEVEDDYMKEVVRSVNLSGGASSVIDSTLNAKDKNGQIGTTTPRYFGAIDTFVVNPSNVGIGIISRMIETDASVLSSVQFKSLMMLSKVGEYHHEDQEIKDFVNSFLSKMCLPTWEKSLEAQSSCYGYGFSVSEIIWGLNKQNQKVPVKIKTYHPSTICFELDAFGEITENGVVQFVIQTAQVSNPNQYFPYFQYGFTVKNPFETPNDRLVPYRMPFINNYGLARIPRNKVIHHTNNSMLSFGSPYGKTSVRTAHLAWQMKVYFMKQMGIAGKRMASPFVWATAPMNNNKVKYTKPDGTVVELNPVEALTDILANRENDDAIVTGSKEQGYNLEAISAQMDLNQHLEVLKFLDTQIFRAFLLPSLVMTDGGGGSRSLGDKHFQLVDFIAGEEAKTFGQEVINQMIKPAIEMNFGEQDDYGKFTERPQSVEERERLANMFSTLANAGYMKAYDKVDGDYVRSSLHLPKQDESFYVEPMPNFDPIGGDGDEDIKEGSQETPEDDDKNKVKKEEASKTKPVGTGRQKSANDDDEVGGSSGDKNRDDDGKFA